VKKVPIPMKAGLKGLAEETARWRQMPGTVEKLLAEEQPSCRVQDESCQS
jgi:hypothetical protein